MMLLAMSSTTTYAQKILGGDLSLVPAYEAAGDQWLDESGNIINSHYSDGMITYVRDQAKWNSVRVRLLVDPTADGKAATCQDLEYVKRLGKRVKDAGLCLLLDIFYSDTWTDVAQQWIPASWGFDRSTPTATLAAKVKSYTTEVLDALTDAGARPDYIQLGNEVSYGMLWDTATGANKGNWFTLGSSYQTQQSKIERFAALLKAAREGISASKASTAKTILHCERTGNATHCTNFYQWVEQAGFTDYDIIGLSYYPFWHGSTTYLRATLNSLQKAFPQKEIHIVETGYFSNNGVDASKLDVNTSSTWAFSPEGQAKFLTDLVALLGEFANVKGLYYWQPEECGNGSDGTTNRVMDDWDNRGFWALSWRSGTHALQGAASLKAMKAFVGADDEPQENDVTSLFQNMNFDKGTTDVAWSITTSGWGSGPAPTAVNEWHSSLTSGYLMQAWVKPASGLEAGRIIWQSRDDMPAGTYTVTATVHTDYDGLLLFANDDTKVIPATSEWATAYNVQVSTTLATPGTLTFGLSLATKPTATGELNFYADNFKVSQQLATGIETVKSPVRDMDNAWHSLDGRRVSQPAKGIYLHGGRKVVVR